MKLTWILFLGPICGLVFSASAEVSENKAGAVETHVAANVETKWPTDSSGLLNHLNTWDKTDMDVAERPSFYKGRKPSGETVAWVNAHKKKLQSLGTIVAWDFEKQRYQIEDPKKSKTNR